MAKKQSFGDKVLRQKAEAKRMAKVVVAERKENGHIRFRAKMVDVNDVKEELKAAKA
ncbi:MAG: hypothetical protein JJ896_04105 [Rhodothermales bacterium]|nr:hypothetical protein [Rhodothermales bacterium]MBO6778816.1 hypothetical protein [Rhodothermales bacterium]